MDRQHNGQKTKENNDLQNTAQKTKIEQHEPSLGLHEPHSKPEVNSCAPKVLAVPAPLVERVVLLQVQIIPGDKS